jgi:hypothetical protein
MSKFYEVSSDTVDRFNKVFNKKSFPLSIKFQFIGSESQKTLIKMSKLTDQLVFLLDKELLVAINEDLMSVFDDESITILIEQEIDKVSIDIQSGKIKMIKPNLNTFTSLINKYGVDKVAKANSVETLFNEQKEDKENDFVL